MDNTNANTVQTNPATDAGNIIRVKKFDNTSIGIETKIKENKFPPKFFIKTCSW